MSLLPYSYDLRDSQRPGQDQGRDIDSYFLTGSGKALEEHEGWEILLWLLLKNSICYSYLTSLRLIFVPPVLQIPVQNFLTSEVLPD